MYFDITFFSFVLDFLLGRNKDNIADISTVQCRDNQLLYCFFYSLFMNNIRTKYRLIQLKNDLTVNEE